MRVNADIELKQLTLENQHVRLQMLPEVGSKITSLLYVPDNREFLFQPPVQRLIVNRSRWHVNLAA